jgi:3-deoxy-manno-octulosonate cytidylyltransferase (CMP-KDO synthetase)
MPLKTNRVFKTLFPNIFRYICASDCIAMIIGIIPARYASSRFPGKPLVNIGGKSMIQRVYEQAMKSTSLERVLVATDDERIAQTVRDFGGDVKITRDDHPSGTDRCAEVADAENLSENDVVINIQGDEPFIAPEQIDTLCALFSNPMVQLATLYKSFQHTDDANNPNTIKLTTDIHGKALYFSRALIPFPRSGNSELKFLKQHIGIYGYRAGMLKQISALKPTILEQTEMLEQLRWLENGFEIHTSRSEHSSWSIDTPDDLKKVLQHFTL